MSKMDFWRKVSEHQSYFRIVKRHLAAAAAAAAAAVGEQRQED